MAENKEIEMKSGNKELNKKNCNNKRSNDCSSGHSIRVFLMREAALICRLSKCHICNVFMMMQNIICRPVPFLMINIGSGHAWEILSSLRNLYSSKCTASTVILNTYLDNQHYL